MIKRANGWMFPLLPAVFAGLLAGSVPARAETFPLAYRADGNSARFPLPLGKSEVRFKKEPDYAGDHVVRSALYVAPGQKEYVGFACDLKKNELYLDLNRNLDLTDDPDGIRTNRSDGWGREFSDIVIPVQQEGRRRDVAVSLQIYGDRYGRYTVQSSWESDAVVLGGRTCHVAVVDNGDGVVDSEDTLYFQPISAAGAEKDDGEKIELDAPARLALDGDTYQLAYELSADGKTLALSVEPADVPLVGVALAGKGIERIVMQEDASAGIFYGPGAAIWMPAGNYSADVRVKSGEGNGASLWASRNARRRVREGDGEPWRVGGPIVGKLACRKTGGRLRFDQEVFGAGGETYSLVHSAGPSFGNPELRVKKAGKVIHAGKFEYG
ncbi:MAG: hypothetical protein AB7V14_05825 [Kiritimatiellia bacterium]